MRSREACSLRDLEDSVTCNSTVGAYLESSRFEGTFSDVRQMVERVLDVLVDGLEAHVLNRVVCGESQPQRTARRGDDWRKVVSAILAWKKIMSRHFI